MSLSTDELIHSIAYELPHDDVSLAFQDQVNRCNGSGYKRFLDIVLCVLALIVLAPVLVLISLGILIQDRGPVFFRQNRTGLDGKIFRIWKFRTMKVQPATASFQQINGKNDPRVTSFGRWLRALSLDELPQLLNILKGDMSLVGPRPHPIDLDEIYAPLNDCYVLRQRVRPGLTGLAQIMGARGAINSLPDMETRLEYDLSYIRGWSFLRDIVIIFKTLNLRKIMTNAH